MNSFSSALEYFFGSYPVAASLVLVGACAMVALVSSKITKMQDAINGKPCKDHKDMLSKHNDTISGMRADIKTVNSKVDILLGIVNSRQSRSIITSINDFSEKNSPRALNEYGLAVLSNSKGEQFLAENKAFFIAEIEKLAPKTALDVENLSLGVLRIHLNDDMFIPLKNWVYNAPSMDVKGDDGSIVKKDISMDDVLFILSLPLRDLYLELHPELINEE